MTSYCPPCNTYCDADEVLECHNCGRIICKNCIDDEESRDERECGCEHLCSTCRAQDECGKCSFCGKNGCPLCLEGACLVCGDDGMVQFPACDDCLHECELCEKYTCPFHLLSNKLPDVAEEKKFSPSNYCIACVDSAFGRKRKKQQTLKK